MAAEQRARFAGAEGVVFIGVAQEKAHAVRASKRMDGPLVGFQYSRQPVHVNDDYFYLLDDDFGPAFIKVCTDAPFTLKVYLNGHEWAKRQLQRAGVAFEALDNGFRSCADPARLQAVCDALGAAQIQAFFAKWLARLPLPLTEADRRAGYDDRLSVWQVEVSRTQVFAEPAQGRACFEEVIREHLDLGRPDRIQLVFERRIRKDTPGLERNASSRMASPRASTSTTRAATSSSISRRAARSGLRRRSTTRRTGASARTSATWPRSTASGGRSIGGSWPSNGSARPARCRGRGSSGWCCRPSPTTANGRPGCVSATAG